MRQIYIYCAFLEKWKQLTCISIYHVFLAIVEGRGKIHNWC